MRLNSEQFKNHIDFDADDARELLRQSHAIHADALRKTILLHCIFPIDCSSTIASIRGCRIGKVDTGILPIPRLNSTVSQVPNEEINVACGYMAELLCVLARGCDVVTEPQISIRPQGSRSVIEVQRNPKKREILDLFISDKIFSWKTFGPALVEFAQCTAKVVVMTEKQLFTIKASTAFDPPAGLSSEAPFKIEGEKVGGFSIKHGDASDETWTKGMRNLLAVLRWVVEAQHAASGDPR
jgi:hypothetical protein